MARYPVTYSDANGSETTTLENDGETLRVILRGVELCGPDFDSLSPAGASPDDLRSFTLNQDCLCACRLECRIPVPVNDHGRLSEGTLLVTLVLGEPTPRGGLDREELRIVLEHDGRKIAGRGRAAGSRTSCWRSGRNCRRGFLSRRVSTVCIRTTALTGTGFSAG